MPFTKQKSQPHLRRAIRHRVRALMREYVDVDTARVFLSRPHPAFINELPCLAIYFVDEPANAQDSAPRTYVRTASINVDFLHQSRDSLEEEPDFTLDDYLDSRAFEIEHAMLHDRFLGLGDWLRDTRLVNTVPTNIVFPGDQFCAALRVNFDVEYEMQSFTNASLEEFLRFYNDIDTEVLGAQSSDHVTIREE